MVHGQVVPPVKLERLAALAAGTFLRCLHKQLRVKVRYARLGDLLRRHVPLGLLLHRLFVDDLWGQGQLRLPILLLAVLEVGQELLRHLREVDLLVDGLLSGRCLAAVGVLVIDAVVSCIPWALEEYSMISASASIVIGLWRDLMGPMVLSWALESLGWMYGSSLGPLDCLGQGLGPV